MAQDREEGDTGQVLRYSAPGVRLSRGQRGEGRGLPGSFSSAEATASHATMSTTAAATKQAGRFELLLRLLPGISATSSVGILAPNPTPPRPSTMRKTALVFLSPCLVEPLAPCGRAVCGSPAQLGAPSFWCFCNKNNHHCWVLVFIRTLAVPLEVRVVMLRLPCPSQAACELARATKATST